ncbi:MAG TPA: hypothetical protein VEB22_05245 [Phycisphaerales bacterium]|nr:hypothetical protein [Phycisphaerales bacterium]
MRSLKAGCAGLVIAAVSLAYWIATVFLVDLTYFGDAVTVAARNGYLAVYWDGADAENDHNSEVLSGWSWPGRPSGTGVEWSLNDWGRWMVYGPKTLLSSPSLAHRWEYPQNAGFFWPGIGVSRGIHYVGVPAWCGGLVGLGLWGHAVWRRRRANAGCRRCGYSVRGLALGAVCPECGPMAGDKAGD